MIVPHLAGRVSALLLVVCLLFRCTYTFASRHNVLREEKQQEQHEFEVDIGQDGRILASSAATTATAGGTDANGTPGAKSTTTASRVQTFELGGELLQRIQEKLQSLGISSGGKNNEQIQLVAMEEWKQWKQEEAQRESLMQQRLEAANEEPTQVFPYELVPPPEPNANGEYSLDFVKNWTPPGGGRYAEYALGNSPYIITEELQQKSDEIARLRRPYIQEAMKFAWDGYTRYAYGMDEIRPQSKKGTNHFGGIGVTLVDSLDTLWLMNMKDEFWQARDYVRDELTHNQNRKVSVFETTIRSLGGLLSAYDWSKDPAFLEQALDLARRLMRAFDNNGHGNATVLPFGEINLSTGHSNMIPWAGG